MILLLLLTLGHLGDRQNIGNFAVPEKYIGVFATLTPESSSGSARPSATYTPGVTRDLSQHAVCTTRWGLDHRHVSLAMKKLVFTRYHIPWSRHAEFEVDHLIPRELGGADDVNNLWPQVWVGAHNAHMKDVLENKLRKRVCVGEMSLADAQDSIREDWIASYRLYVR